jgi:murein DD-endopeptidase MepM/ murein hydrolase activator NlpD
VALFTPSKLIGAKLTQLAGSFTPAKQFGAGENFAPADPSYLPAKVVNTNMDNPYGVDPGLGYNPVGGLNASGVPVKFGSAQMAGYFPTADPRGTGTGTTAQPTQTATLVGGDWAGVEQWSSQIAAAAAKYGVPVNLIKAVMKLESDGDPNATGSAGVWGPMQVNSSAWGYGPWSTDPAANIDKGVQILAGGYNGDWNQALINYRGGWGSDGYTTGQQYLDIVNGNWTSLNNATAGGSGAVANSGYGQTAQTTSFTTLFSPQAAVYDWGEFNVPSGNGLYGYGTDYGLNGNNHTGLDVAMDPGTPMRAAFNGHVVCAGTNYGTGEDSCAAFNCSGYCVGGAAGRVEIMSADGNTVLIYGHASTASVTPGQQVNAGTVVGTSGGMNSGHVHLEARVRDASTPSGWRIVDPRTVMNGTLTPAVGSPNPYQQTSSGSGSFARSLTNFAQNWGR